MTDPVDTRAPAPVPLTATDAAVQRRVVAVLAGTQVLAGVGVATALAVSTLVATRLSGSETVGGLALTAVVLGSAAAALVLSRVATRRGRRPALTLGFGGGAVGAAGAVGAVALGSAGLLLASLVLLGAATAAGLAARFAATDLAPPGRRARSLALVVWATTVGAVAGPNLAAPAQGLGAPLGLPPEAGPFLLCVLAFAGAPAGVAIGLRPDPLLRARERDGTAGVAAASVVSGAQVRAALLASPPALLGLAGVVLGHLVMIGLMSMTPVHMDHGGADLQLVGLVISLHVAGMYALSPLFGWLADRAGRIRVLALAALLLGAAAIVSSVADPHATALLSVGLVLLGLGWSAGLIAGSALLTESMPVPLRPRAQGLADVSMNIAGALGGITAGLVVAGTSFAVLGIAAAALVLPYLLLAGVAAARPGRARAHYPQST
ncbi:MAG: MFS transporter [Pseudonocardia sp.]